MKKLVLITLCSILFLIVTSCSKSDDVKADETSSPTSTAKFIKFKCNGTLYEFNDPDVINSLSKSIFQFENNVKRVNMFVPLNVTPGTYNITDEPSNVNAYQFGLEIIALGLEGDATSGTMVITSVVGNNVKGTFSTTISSNGQSYAITEGSFDAGYNR